jgi:hypothetical protein
MTTFGHAVAAKFAIVIVIVLALALLSAQTLVNAPKQVKNLTGANFVDQETPSGIPNGSVNVFMLVGVPNPPTSLHLYQNGIRLSPNVDFTLSGNTITFILAATPQFGDMLVADYRK